MVLEGLSPRRVFYYFEKLCSVPHGSYNTKIISDMLTGFAKDLGLEYIQDGLNNVVIKKPAGAGYENVPAVIIQAHMDMVCAKTDDCTKDMASEGLDLMTDGKLVWADKTSLGGDDCIGVAIALALLEDDSFSHPAIEAVFTTEEEVGMDGAFGMDMSILKGKYLLNLDSESAGVFTVSCAGGCKLDASIPARRIAPPKDHLAAKLTVCGLLGGHSGCEIGKGRANANILLGNLLNFERKHIDGMLLVDAKGGQFDNVITSFAEATVIVPAPMINSLNSIALRYKEMLLEELGSNEPGLDIKFQALGTAEALDFHPFIIGKTQRILSLWGNLKQGLIKWSQDFDDLPQTSLNMGIMATTEDSFDFTYLVRSSINEEKEELVQYLISAVKQAGGTYERRSDYPAWPFRKESAFRDLAMKVYEEKTGISPRLEGTHGGLECGIFADRIECCDALSLGPDLFDIHSPRERLDVKSTEDLYIFVRTFLEELKA